MSDQPASDDAGQAAVSAPSENGFDVMTAKDPGAEGLVDVYNEEDAVNAPGASSADEGPDLNEDDPEQLEASDELDESEDAADGEQDESEADAEDGEGEEEWVEVDIDGVTETIPARLKDAFMKNRDYTQKNQTLAENRKQLEDYARRVHQQAQAIEQQKTQVRQLSEQDMALQSELGQINQTIAQYEQQAEQIEALGRSQDQQDQVEYLKYVQAYEQLKAKRNDLGRQWTARQQQATAQQRHMIEQRQTQTWKWATENVPDFGPERWGKMKQLAASYGINEQALTENIGPAEVKILDLALRGAELEAAKQNPPKAKPKLTKNFKPSKGVKGKGNPRPQPRLDTMDMKEYLAALDKS